MTEGGIARSILTPGLDGGEWYASSSGLFTPREMAPDIHCIEPGWDPEPVWTE
jgi:hypothetical protein